MRGILQSERSWPSARQIVVPALAIAFAFGVVACGSKSSSTTTSTTTTTTAAATTTVAKPAAKPVTIPASAAPRAKAYIAAHGADVKLVVTYESAVQVAISQVVNSPLMTPLQQATQKQYNKLYKLLPKFAGPYSKDALGVYEKRVAVQAAAIDKSMETLLNYTAFPTPATLTEYTDQYQAAVLAWNKAIKAIWTVASAPTPPTICTTC